MHPYCEKHPDVRLICPAEAGAKGGNTPSEERIRWARINGRKGGRPREEKDKPKRRRRKTVAA